jgi:hypothetical protein
MRCKPFAVDNYHTDILLLFSPLNTSSLSLMLNHE